MLYKYKLVLTLKAVNETLSVTIEMKDIEQCFHLVRSIILHKLFLTHKSLNKTLASDHSNESC